MQIVVEMSQIPGWRWEARVRQGKERGADLLAGRNLADRTEAQNAATEALEYLFCGYRFTVVFVDK